MKRQLFFTPLYCVDRKTWFGLGIIMQLYIIDWHSATSLETHLQYFRNTYKETNSFKTDSSYSIIGVYASYKCLFSLLIVKFNKKKISNSFTLQE